MPHLTAAVTSTAALLRASGVAFEVVKVLGVAYLLYMAWATWREVVPKFVELRWRPVVDQAALTSSS